MKILVNSKQIFEEYTDSVSEEYTGEFVLLENGFKIKYNNSEVVLVDEILTVKTENTDMIIEPNKTNSSKLQTPYGIIDLEIKGEFIRWTKEPFLLEVRYMLKMGNTREYINELQLQIINED